MGINTKIDNTRKSIITVINNSELPISMIKYIMSDIYKEVELVEKNVLATEKQQEQEEVNSGLEGQFEEVANPDGDNDENNSSNG